MDSSIDFCACSIDFAPDSINFHTCSIDFTPDSIDFRTCSIDFAPDSIDFRTRSIDFASDSINFHPNQSFYKHTYFFDIPARSFFQIKLQYHDPIPAVLLSDKYLLPQQGQNRLLRLFLCTLYIIHNNFP